MLSSLDKYQLKQFALRESFENLLFRAENEGKLPLGLFKTVAVKRLKEEIDEIQEGLQTHAINPQEIFQIEFCPNCPSPIQLEKDKWLCPAIALSLEDGSMVSIIGNLSHVSPKGLLDLNKGSVADAWRVWPKFLLYSYAVKLIPMNLKPELIFIQSTKKKRAFFEDPEHYLRQLIHYYNLCISHFSLLMPDWIPLILDGDDKGLREKMIQLYSDFFGSYQDNHLRWILNKRSLPSPEAIIQDWKTQAENLMGDIIKFWYAPEREKARKA